MENKSSKTAVTLIIGGIILVLAAVVLMKFWVSILTLLIGFGFGFYFGYTKRKSKS